MALEVRVPGQPVALLLVTLQPQVWQAVPTTIRPAGVLAVVEHQHVGAGSLGGDEERVLRHVPGPVDLPLQIYFNVDLNLAEFGAVSTLALTTIGCSCEVIP